MSENQPDSRIAGLSGIRACSFESRRGAEMRGLLERQGARVTVVPSMREVPLADNPEALAFAERLLASSIDVVIFLTGVGARALLETVETRFARREFLDALARPVVVVRGPKPAAVLREWSVRIDHQVPEPNTWRELLSLLDERVPVAGRDIAVQEYGEANARLYEGLSERNARVIAVPVYRWALPDEIAPLHEAVQDTIAGKIDVLLFTSAQQLRHVLSIAQSAGVREAWLAAANRCAIASIGPTASETLVEAGLPPDIEPEHPRMGQLVQAVARHARTVLGRKRRIG
jgi:uroporphyrinogen-III synthase